MNERSIFIGAICIFTLGSIIFLTSGLITCLLSVMVESCLVLITTLLIYTRSNNSLTDRQERETMMSVARSLLLGTVIVTEIALPAVALTKFVSKYFK